MEKIVLLMLVAVLAVTDAADWTYTPGPYGPQNWTRVSAFCGLKRQSPIDIITSTAQEKNGVFLNFTGAYFAAPPTGTKFMLTNNGHTLGAVVRLPANSPYSLVIHGIKYIPYQYHFHWGSDNTKGSEHLVDGIAYPLEVHFIHLNTKYGTTTEALKHGDGLAVIGTLYEIGAADPALAKLTPHFSKITSSGTNTTINAFQFSEVLPGETDMTRFYHYLGSLTTPNCQEAVHWYVMEKKLTVSATQMAALRSLRNTAGASSYSLSNNYRPVQSLNGRTVYKVGGASGVMRGSKDTLVLAVLASSVAMLSALL